MPDVEAPSIQLCIEASLECHRLCSEAALRPQSAGIRIGSDPAATLLNCAELSMVNAHFLMARAPEQHAVVQACATVSRTSAEALQDLTGLQDCAQICQVLAESCLQLLRLPAPPRRAVA
ncbi:hypothetical protein [Solimonas sp. SE-A11]|jgi:hypothetical protein|uniref:hypothetical protein n=1 Tax=Solimonas sp. SE-A11 TaxID=3054954 RepID=UPI00259CEFFD|nr:hypothetical protein [Solimonas sp. SE-A11]MDM4771388.1 hypothetical protein [Solimonas sp. SE-A11]